MEMAATTFFILDRPEAETACFTGPASISSLKRHDTAAICLRLST